MRRAALLLGLTVALVCLPAVPAEAACEWVTTTQVIDGHSQTKTVMVCPPGEGVPASDPTPDNGPRNSGLDAICVAMAMSLGEDIFEYCNAPPEGSPPEITPGMVATALQQLPIPPSVLQVEPPNGRTLVNFDTNFYAVAQPIDTSFRLLGQGVDLHIIPNQFVWQFGDGKTMTTEDPGAPYPDLDVTHAYLEKGGVAPRVDTTYTAQFRVNGGPWQDVPGSVTIEGAPVQLEVLTATPVLVGYDS